MNWENFFSIALDNYGLVIEGYLGDFYIPWRTLILAGLIFAGFKIKSWLKTRKEK